MRNQQPDDAFRKEILVGKYFDKRYRVDILFDQVYYYPGDTLNANIHFVDPAGKSIAATEFGYSLGSFSKVFTRGSGKTDPNGNFHLMIPLTGFEDVPVLTFDLKSRRLAGEYTVIIPASGTTPDISFYPEGGSLVDGIKVDMAIRCRDPFGIPASLEGEVINRNGQVFQKVKTGISGLGVFSYYPTGDSTFLRITKPSGSSRLFPLPVAAPEGTVLRFSGIRNDTAYFQTESKGDTDEQPGYCLAIAGQKLVYAEQVKLHGEQSIHIPLQGISNEFLQVSVLNFNREVIAERVVLVRGTAILKVETDRHIYRTRQRVILTAEYSGEGAGAELATMVSLRQLSFSPMNPTIVQTASGFPFDTLSKYATSPLEPSDIEIMTSGFQLVRWPVIFGQTSLHAAYRKKEGISGVVTDKKDNPAQHAKVRITHIPNFRFYETQTDENGTFNVSFGGDIIDFNYLNIEAYDARGKINLSASVNQEYISGVLKKILSGASGQTNQKILNTVFYGDPDVVYSLRYGPRKYRKTDTEIRKRYDPARYTDYASVLDIIRDIIPCEVVNKTIVFTDSTENFLTTGVQEGAIIVINGLLKGTNCEVLNSLLPSDVTNINISGNIVDVHRYTPLNFQGVIELTTIQGMYRYRQPSVQLGMDILNTLREFNSPDYSLESVTGTDSRKTLYWNPQITVSREHPALIMFYTSDIRGTYYGKMEGIDRSGKPVVCDFSFLVE
jgi:hypothetical protein